MQELFNHEMITDFIEYQLAVWPLAKKNYDALANVERREIVLNGYPFYVQFNPARILSTGADMRKETLTARKCFLCSENRPAEQTPIEILPGWDMLVNPYPIFPVHLTLASRSHVPQSGVPKEIVEMALKLPGMAIFYNGAKAGASAPDHLHMQAVLKDELPLVRLVEKVHPESAPMVLPSDSLLPGFPYLFYSGVVDPGDKGVKTLLAGLYLGGSETGEEYTDHDLVNTFFWIGQGGKLRFISIPRKAHRPRCYNAEGTDRKMISPGCVDMASLIITPRKEDFDSLSETELLKIYDDVAFKPRNHGKNS